MEIEFKLERRIGALSDNPSGYTKELNVVVWDGKYTKYDLAHLEPQRQARQGRDADQRGAEEAAQAHRRGTQPRRIQ